MNYYSKIVNTNEELIKINDLMMTFPEYERTSIEELVEMSKKIGSEFKVYYSDNDIMKSVRIDDLSKEITPICEWSYNIWLRNIIFLEQAMYMPAQYGGDVSIEDFEGNINYN